MTQATEPAPAKEKLPILSYGRWEKTINRPATWVLIDQAIVSAGNFLTALFLARFLPQTEYGTFGVLWDTILYLNSLQAALIIYPLTLKGATGDRVNLGRLTTAAIILTMVLLPILGGATLFSLGALHNYAIALGAIAALLMWQLQETTRRALMSHLRFSETIWGDAISYLGQAALILSLGMMGQLTLNRVFLVMGLSSALAIFVQTMQIGLQKIRIWELRLVIRDFWRLGRWMMLSNGGGAISALAYPWTLNWSHGANECAIFYAIVNLFKLANPLMSSMSGMIVPLVARSSVTDGMRATTRIAMRYILFGAVMLTPYFLLLLVIPGILLRFIYGGQSPYLAHAGLLQFFVVNYTMVYISTVIGAWLAGLGRARWNFYSQVFSAAASLLVGLPLTVALGAKGLVLGGMFSAGISALSCAVFIRRAARLQPLHHDAPPASDPPVSGGE